MAVVSDQEQALANLLVGALQAREQEGVRLSKVLHDEVGQALSAVGLHLDLLRMDLNENPADCEARISEIQVMLERAMAHVRDLSYELNPNVVERAGLEFALDRLAGRFRKGYAGTIRLFVDSTTHIPRPAATAMYKIAEQAIENSVAHAGASQVEVLVRPSRQGYCLEVRDNGTGFRTDDLAVSKGLGTRLMTYQAEQAGLVFSLVSQPGQGTIVKAIFRSEQGKQVTG
jgi:two-component system, chemotaxis family, CheB/CheR fusion protein